MNKPTLPIGTRRLLSNLVSALLGQQTFTPGRPEATRTLTALGEGVCRWLEQNPRLLLIGGNPADPLTCSVLGLAGGLIDPSEGDGRSDSKETQINLAGFWRDRRLVLISLRKGLVPSEFNHLFHLLNHYAGKGLQLRSRLFEEQSRGHLPHVSMVFLDDLPATEQTVSWAARVSLAWLYRDLNLLSRAQNLPATEQVDWREQLLEAAVTLPSQANSLPDFFANLDVISELIDDYNKDELVYALLEHLDDDLAGELCRQLCDMLDRLQENEDSKDNPEQQRYTAVKWVARRLAEHMLEGDLAGPEHLHALVLHKVLLYEEIPRQMRPGVASLQVLTSFLSDPLKYFNEVESSHSPEVLETRLWRILEMVPRLVQVLRFDVARQVLDFSQRFGPTFELHSRPDVMDKLLSAAADVMTQATREQQVTMMKELPQMGLTGIHLLIDLTDHRNPSVHRASVAALINIGQPVVPVLFETLEKKKDWSYLTNMLLILAQLNAGGPKVERLFRRCVKHPETNVRMEALQGLAQLLRAEAALIVAQALDDPDPEVRKRAAACLGLTGISAPEVYQRLAEILAAKNCGDDLAIQIVAAINRLRPEPPDHPALESALISFVAGGGILGIGGRKVSSSVTLRIAVVQALGYVGGERSVKALKKLASGQEPEMSKAVADSLQRLSVEPGR